MKKLHGFGENPGASNLLIHMNYNIKLQCQIENVYFVLKLFTEYKIKKINKGDILGEKLCLFINT